MSRERTQGLTTYQKLIAVLVVSTVYSWGVDSVGGTHIKSLFEATSAFLATITLSVLVAFRTNSAYDRWWEGRKLWGQLTNNTRNLALKVESFVPGQFDWKKQLAFELSSFPVLVKDYLRQIQPAGSRRGAPAGPPKEHPPLATAQRICALINNLRKEQLIDGFQQLQLDTNVNALMDICGACERIKLTPVVPSYRMFFRVGIALNVLGLPWFLVPEFHLWAIPIELIACFFLVGLELIAEAVEEPFGVGSDKLPLESMCKGMQVSVKQVLGDYGEPVESVSVHTS